MPAGVNLRALLADDPVVRGRVRAFASDAGVSLLLVSRVSTPAEVEAEPPAIRWGNFFILI